jgi:DNA-binding transcriptional regulator YdaS (Cro superfamily)
MQITALERAISLFSNQTRLAAATGFSQHAVWAAVKRGRVSARMAVAIHRATRGVVSKADLRPDLFAEE